MNSKTKGKRGEEIVCRHYELAGAEILETNYRFRRCEIDLIALDRNKLLVFVEVKTRSRKDYGEPESFVSNLQRERIREAAEDYIFAINWEGDIRFDIACVDMKNKIEIFEDAF